MPMPKTTLIASHSGYLNLLAPQLRQIGFGVTKQFEHGVARVVLDYPLTWGLRQLTRLSSFERSHTLVCTQARHAAYLDCLASFHVAAVAHTFDKAGVLAGLHAAANAQRYYAYRAGLTYMELRVTRLLLTAACKQELIDSLGVSVKTINAHVSNILTKLGLESRAQYVAMLLGDEGVPAA